MNETQVNRIRNTVKSYEKQARVLIASAQEYKDKTSIEMALFKIGELNGMLTLCRLLDIEVLDHEQQYWFNERLSELRRMTQPK